MSVNYLIEINALDDWELTHPLSATAYKTLRKLLYLANKERFPERITVPNGMLMSMVGCSEDSLIKARNQLIQAGLIAYKGQKKLTPVYTLNYFSENPIYNPKIQSYEQGIEQGIKQSYEQGIKRGNEQGTIINKIKENGEEERAREDLQPSGDCFGSGEETAAAYFKRCGIAIQGKQYEALREFYDAGISDDMLRFAADEAVEYGKLNFAYIRRVVDNWICAGVRTLADAKARQAKFQREQSAARSDARERSAVRQACEQPAPPAPRFFSERWDNV